MREELEEALQMASRGGEVGLNGIMTLLSALPGEEEEALFSLADKVREEVMGDEVHLRGLIEFSNHCFRNCLYCGLRRSNSTIHRYRMEVKDIIRVAVEAAALGYKTIVLQSGEDPYYTADRLCEIIRGIKSEADVAITLCVGERRADEYYRFREAGADRYLLKQETSDESLYNYLHPGMSYKGRVDALRVLGELGYQRGSGNIVGLPGQSLEKLARDILFFKEWDVEMVGIGPFIAHSATPLGGHPNGSVDLTLRVVAVTRLLLPYAHIPATTAIGTLDPLGRQKALMAGANVVMPNVTPIEYRQRYEIYPGKICINEGPQKCRGCIEGIINSIGRRVGEGYGHSPKVLLGISKSESSKGMRKAGHPQRDMVLGDNLYDDYDKGANSNEG